MTKGRIILPFKTKTREKREKGGKRERKEKVTEKERRLASATEAGEKGGTHPRAGKPQVSIAAAVLQFPQMISNQRSLFLSMHPKRPQQFL